MKPIPKRLFASIFSLIFVLFGLGLVVSDLPFVIEAWQSTNWPAVDGSITHSEVDYVDHAYYRPRVRYSYQVDGSSHEGERVSYKWTLANQNRSKQRAHRYLSPYDLNARVRVYYDPTMPSTSTLEPGLGKGTFVWLAGGMAFAIFGVAVFLLTIPDSGRKSQLTGAVAILLVILLLPIAIWTAI